MTSVAGGGERLLDGLCSDYVDDQVYSLATGYLENVFWPVGVLAVVDDMFGAETLRNVELFFGRRQCNYMCSSGGSKLVIRQI